MWDNSGIDLNNSYGVNEWSQAKVMKLLNPGYESESVGGSLYWNQGSGRCYYRYNNYVDCDFSKTGLNSNAKNMIEDVLWYVGSDSNEERYNQVLTSRLYEMERFSNNGKTCTDENYVYYCNDEIEKTHKWVGKVGLVSGSDYGYATGERFSYHC